MENKTLKNELVIMGISNEMERELDYESFYFETTRILEIQNASFRAIIGESS